MIKSNETKDLSAAFIAAQKAIGKAFKNSANPHFKSKYSDLESIIDCAKDALNDNGLSFMQAINWEDGSAILETEIRHETGQFISCKTPIMYQKKRVPLCVKEWDQTTRSTKTIYNKDENGNIIFVEDDCSQAFGSAVSYAKRYALQSMLGIPSSDDDGNAACYKSEPIQQQQQQPTFSPKQTELEELQHLVAKHKISKADQSKILLYADPTGGSKQFLQLTVAQTQKALAAVKKKYN